MNICDISHHCCRGHGRQLGIYDPIIATARFYYNIPPIKVNRWSITSGTRLGEGERSRGMRVLVVDLAVRLAGIVGTTEPHSEAASLHVILQALPGLLCRTNPLI